MSQLNGDIFEKGSAKSMESFLSIGVESRNQKYDLKEIQFISIDDAFT